MNAYRLYCRDVIIDSPVLRLSDHQHYARELLKFLWDENVIVNYVWMVISGYPHLTMYALVEDEDGDEYQCIARWEYDDSMTSDPYGPHYELVDVELTDIPGGM